MLLDEAGALERSSLLGIDCRQAAVTRATAGVFDEHDLATMHPELRRRYFQGGAGHCSIIPLLREKTRWQKADLLAFEPDKPFDLVLFRNVAIYLDAAHSAMAWERVASQVAPGGYVVTGKAEKPPGHLPFVKVAGCVYRRAGGL
jgi:chemotaxis protein methyltransferase CheR